MFTTGGESRGGKNKEVVDNALLIGLLLRSIGMMIQKSAKELDDDM